MSKQTAMQELIKEMESLKNMKPYVNPQNALQDCISLAYSKLSMEEKQIVEAYIEAGPRLEDITKEAAEQYYQQTYGDKQ